MREKRPRISNNRSNSDRLEQNDSDRGTNENIDAIEDTSLVKGKLPDIVSDELWQNDYDKQTGIIDYQIELDVKQSDESKDSQIDSFYNSSLIKDIYDTIDYDHSI